MSTGPCSYPPVPSTASGLNNLLSLEQRRAARGFTASLATAPAGIMTCSPLASGYFGVHLFGLVIPRLLGAAA